MARITDRALAAKPKEKDLWLYDGAISKGHGELCVRITHGGSRVFYFRYTVPARTKSESGCPLAGTIQRAYPG